MLSFLNELERQAKIKYLNDLPIEELAQLDLDNYALPKLERAVRLLNEARRTGDLGQMTRAQRRLGWAVVHVGRCLVQGAELEGVENDA